MSVYTVGSSKSSDSIFPKVRPSLDLHFANSKTLDPRITFTRSSGGSYVGADGLIKYAGVNEARFDHNPVTGESLGLLIEEQRTNLIANSITLGNIGEKPTSLEFANLVVGQSAVVSEDILDVDGNRKCIKHTRGNLGDNNVGYYTSGGMSSLTIGQTYTFSIYVYIPSSQKNKITSIRFGPDSGFSSITFGFANLNILDKWQRVVGSFVTSTTFNTPFCRASAENGAFFYTDAWQMEVGAFPTSYIPTQTSTVTRAADNAQMTGTNFSSWYNQSEGTVSISCITRGALNSGSNYADFLISNSFTTTYTSRIVGWFNNLVIPYISVFVNNINILLPFIGVPGSSSNIPIKKAIALATRNMRVATNGTIITGNLANTTVPNYLPNDFNRLLLGYEGIFAGYLNGTISRFTYYPKALSNSQLQALTR